MYMDGGELSAKMGGSPQYQYMVKTGSSGQSASKSMKAKEAPNPGSGSRGPILVPD